TLKNPSGGQILSSVDGRSLRFVMKVSNEQVAFGSRTVGCCGFRG
ncbi:Uncharacterized protein APZ42_001856, partial [Daphnia magna]